MNTGIIRYIIGTVLFIEGAVMLLPCMIAIIYDEPDGIYFLIFGLCAMAAGAATAFIKKNKKNTMYAREGFVSVALSWIIVSIVGALPFFASGAIPNFVDALFESMSGFTTTGASILNDIEALSHCMLFWRSFIIWLGGMGILVFIMAILPLAGGQQNMHLMRAESPGPMVGKFLPRLRGTALVLYGIYFFLTVLEFLLLLIGGMPVFDAVNVSLSTAGTGGFGITNAGMASYQSYYLQGVIAIFMTLFGLNFTFYFLIIARKFKQIFHLEEIWWYLGIMLGSTLIITFNISKIYDNDFFAAFHDSFFQVSSLMTSTGFSNTNYDLWPEFSKTILTILMCIGACAGSTGGGFKVSRVIILLKNSSKVLAKALHPRNVKVVKMDGKKVEPTTVHATGAYLAIYVGIFLVSLTLISTNGFDFTTNFSAVAATINNTGPGFNLVGPTCNFSGFDTLPKIVLIFNMLAGRLEFFPLIFLFTPGVWRKQ